MKSAPLSPTQAKWVDHLERWFPHGNVFVLYTKNGMGRTTMLEESCRRLDGQLVHLHDFLDVCGEAHPSAIEESFFKTVLNALKENDRVFVDDLDMVDAISGDCNMFYPRKGMFATVLDTLCRYTIETDKRLVFGGKGSGPEPVRNRCFHSGFERFSPEDIGYFCEKFLGSKLAAKLDPEKIRRFAPKLTAHQLKHVCTILHSRTYLDTDQFIETLRERRMISNVSLVDVESVDLDDLKGADDVLRALDTHLVIPFEDARLAEELQLQPKKGVILYGPPGTGKTTIGRALAHRLKGKFFRFDGNFISGDREFYQMVRRVFAQAKENAPSVIFIDDADVLWENDEEQGLYRYLLTQLDGLENESDGMVCVMMTVMNVEALPPALARSGRFELWLEMRLPGAEARHEILSYWISKYPKPMRGVAIESIVDATDGFTGADLRRLTEDAKNLRGYDVTRKRPIRDTADYLLEAVEVVRKNIERMKAAQAAKSTPSTNDILRRSMKLMSERS
jgi:transitional endoplasmic reticulum ATPase